MRILEAYELIQQKTLSEISSEGYLLRHKKTGARIVLVSNDDDNKVFSIGFRTPPHDSTGVAHINEHSVLCGSRKYPVKDPFVELLKTSLNTFLNAMTYPDKTIYPVASCNDKDFANLMDVYLDAVFYPNTGLHPEIFRQEGWHYELESPEDELKINGVVYSEMKGAFSSPDEVVMREVLNSLFPDTPYGVESGGDPDCIPDLTYEAFMDFHARWYHPSNSYIYLYGNMDMTERLEYLDREYLSAFEAEEIDSAIPLQQAFDAPRRRELLYPVGDEEEETGTYLSWNVVTGESSDPLETGAFKLLDNYLLNSISAPLRRALQEAGIGMDYLGGFDGGIRQPYFSVIAKGAEPEQEKAFLALIRRVLEEQVRKGVDKEAIRGLIHSASFARREEDFGVYPKGLMYGIEMLDTWLYDDDRPFDLMDALAVFDELEKALDQGYFESLIEKKLLQNPHTSVVVMSPSPGLAREKEQALRDKLAAYKASLSEEEIAQIIADTNHLAAYQEEESTPKELATLPKLGREDIRRKARPLDLEVRKIDGRPLIFSPLDIKGILYLQLLFDADHLDFEGLRWLKLYSSLLGRMSTQQRDYGELETVILQNFGSLGGGVSASGRDQDGKRRVFLTLNARLMERDIDRAAGLIKEYLLEPDFTDDARMHTLLEQDRSRFHTRILESGNQFAALRSAACVSHSSHRAEALNGITWYEWLADLCRQMDEDEAGTCRLVREKVCKAADTVLCRRGMTLAVGGSETGLASAIQSLSTLRMAMPEGDERCPAPFPPLPESRDAFSTASAVQYVACACMLPGGAKDYNGTLSVARTILGLDYFWQEVRVRGTAYGCGGSFNADGLVTFSSYRDPHLKRTLDVFEKTVDYLEAFDADEETMEGYLIGTCGGLDIPLTPSMRFERALSAYYNETTDEENQARRDEMLAVTADDIRSLATLLREAMKHAAISVVGSEAKVAEHAALFDRVISIR